MKRKWIFADWKLPSEKDLKLITEMGFTDVVLGFWTDQNGRFRRLYSDKRIIEVAEKIKALGCRVHIMAWVVRDRVYLTKMCEWLNAICRHAGAYSAILDTEKDWHKSTSDLFVSVFDAVQIISKRLDQALKIGVTGLSNLHPTVKPLAERADYVIPQAYSIWKPGHLSHWSHSAETSPYHQQRLSWNSWATAQKPIVMGLSNYWAERHGYSVVDSLWAAVNGVIDVGGYEIAYWSLKHLHKNTEAARIAREFTKVIPVNTDTDTDTDTDAEIILGATLSVQWLLVQLGYDLGNYGPQGDGVDGIFGEKSQKSLEEFYEGKIQILVRDGDLYIPDLAYGEILVDLLDAYRRKLLSCTT